MLKDKKPSCQMLLDSTEVPSFTRSLRRIFHFNFNFSNVYFARRRQVGVNQKFRRVGAQERLMVCDADWEPRDGPFRVLLPTGDSHASRLRQGFYLEFESKSRGVRANSPSLHP